MAIHFGVGTIDPIGNLRSIVADATLAAVFAQSVPAGQARTGRQLTHAQTSACYHRSSVE